MIEGVIITKRDVIPDERGSVLRMLRADDSFFHGFGEIYFSKIYPGMVKGWHLHRELTINYAVPVGMIKLVLYDSRPKSRTNGEITELFIGEENYCLVTIPPNIWNGFKCVGLKIAVVANCTDKPYKSSEVQRMDPLGTKIPYDWNAKWG